MPLLCYALRMKTTTIYACYLPGSTQPDYIGSHATTPPDRSGALKWRYDNCIYLGQGAWIDKATGALIGMPRLNQKTQWGATLMLMTPAQRLAIRIETLAQVEPGERWKVEARALRLHTPPFNALLPQTAEAKRQKLNAFQRGYRKGYYERNPAKADAKRAKDRIAAKTRRDIAKAAKEARAALVSHNLTEQRRLAPVM